MSSSLGLGRAFLLFRRHRARYITVSVNVSLSHAPFLSPHMSSPSQRKAWRKLRNVRDDSAFLSQVLAAKEQKSAFSSLLLHHSLTLFDAALLTPTLSARELKVSRRVDLPRNPSAPRSKPKVGSINFWWPSQDSCDVAMVEPLASYLESMVPAAVCEIAVSFESACCACFVYCVLSLQSPSPACVISYILPLPWQEKRLLEMS